MLADPPTGRIISACEQRVRECALWVHCDTTISCAIITSFLHREIYRFMQRHDRPTLNRFLFANAGLELNNVQIKGYINLYQ
jgi:hypothetical protein